MSKLRLSASAIVGAAFLLSAAVCAAAVTPSAYEPIYPMVSPDGKHLAWVEGQTWRIWIANPDGTDAHVFGSTFANSGIGQISWTNLGMIVDADYTLFKLTSSGKRLRIAPVADQEFSFGGHRVAIDGGHSGGRGTVVDLRTKKVTRIGDVVPVLSTDGTRLAWANATGVWVASATGTNPRQVSSVPAACPAWSPNNKTLAYLAVNGGGNRPDLRVVSVRGGGGRLVAKGITGCDLSWSPDSKKIAMSSARLTVVSVAAGTVRRSPVRVGRVAGGFAWSRDGAFVYVSARPAAAEASLDNCTSLWRLASSMLAGRVLVPGCH